jgi:hypothetical protein
MLIIEQYGVQMLVMEFFLLAAFQDSMQGQIRHFYRLMGLAIIGMAALHGMPLYPWFFIASTGLFLVLFKLDALRGGDGVIALMSLVYPLAFVPMLLVMVAAGVLSYLQTKGFNKFKGVRIGQYAGAIAFLMALLWTCGIF